MDIGIIGAGAMGRTLAAKLTGLGHRVSIANSRWPESLADVAAETGAAAVPVVDAVKVADIVILAIPTKAVAELPRGLFADAPDGLIVIDIGNYHPELRDGRIEAIERGVLDSEWVERQIGRPVIKAFNSILATSLAEKGATKGVRGRIALPVSGGALEDRAVVMSMVDRLGFDPVDVGSLANSFRQQPGTPAYCRDLDAAALSTALAAADRSRVANYRALREAEIKRMIAAQAR
jgi:8-hydroxy-5-deazaflavin:NADPH oxidoreductase